jgi:HSP20 family molecular chaperone IbpA
MSSLIPFSFFPRRMFDMDNWLPTSTLAPSLSTFASPLSTFTSPLSTLDFFDPFDELDRMMSRNLQWIDRPESLLAPLMPTVPHKYRITVDVPGFNADSIKTEIKDNQQGQKQLFVYANEESGQQGGDDYSKRELHKTFSLPNNIDYDKMVSFMAPGGRFVVEYPIKQTELQTQSLLPQLIDVPGGSMQVAINFPLPQSIDPNNVHVSVKDKDLIMRVEQKNETPDTRSNVYMYTRTTLPDNTDFNQLRCEVDNNQLRITAPVNQDVTRSTRNIPIQFRQQQQQIQGGQGQEGQQGQGQEQQKQGGQYQQQFEQQQQQGQGQGQHAM